MSIQLQYTNESRDAVLEEAAAALSNGQAIIFPSDTVYALLAAVDSKSAYSEIYTLKKRDIAQPLALLCSPTHPVVSEVMKLLADFEEEQDAFLGGELTAVFPRGRLRRLPQVALDMQQAGAGLRVPAWEPLSELIERCGGLLWGTSANASGHDPATNPDELQDVLGSLSASPALIVSIEDELPGIVSDVVSFGPNGPQVIR